MYGQIECPFCSKAVRSPLNHPHTYNRSKAWDCLPGASPRATELPYSSADGKAVYRGLEEGKQPNGEGKQVSQRKGRRGTRDAKSRNDPERMVGKLESRMMRKYPVRFGGGLGEKVVRTSLVAYPTVMQRMKRARRPRSSVLDLSKRWIPSQSAVCTRCYNPKTSR